MTTPLSKTQKYQERVRLLMENHGHKLNLPPSCLDKEDRAGLGGGLRCFRMVSGRDEYGNKDPHKEMHRCGNGAVKGSFFCKKHGGGNQYALTTGEQSTTASAYRGVMNVKLGSVFDAFINDPNILDAKPELSALRMCLLEYIKKVSNPKKHIKNSKIMIKKIKKICSDPMIDSKDKVLMIRELTITQILLTDGDAMDRITNVCEAISRMIDRMDKATNKAEFILTPDGFKIFLRCLTEIIREYVTPERLPALKEAILSVSTRTNGDFSKMEDMALKKVN